MDESYAKIFRSMYTGSMYGAGMHVFAVWGWILAHADEEGHVEINPDVVADQLDKATERATVAQQLRTAVQYLMQPDPDSRSPEEEGRRLVHVEGFMYRVVNRPKYRDRGADRSAYWRHYRAKKRDSTNSGATVAQHAQHAQQLRATKITQAEAKAEVEEKNCKSYACARDADMAPPEADCPASAGFTWEDCCLALRRAFAENRTVDAFRAWLSGRMLTMDAAAIDRAVRLVLDLVARSREARKPAAWFIGAVKKPPNEGGFGYRVGRAGGQSVGGIMGPGK